jgi:type II secretory ATPase GspE/PulE/Tfp pilus assembly ATPase PilB-like protein
VHLEPFEEAVRARFRLDGVLRHAADLNPAQREALGSRIKVLAAGL